MLNALTALVATVHPVWGDDSQSACCSSQASTHLADSTSTESPGVACLLNWQSLLDRPSQNRLYTDLDDRDDHPRAVWDADRPAIGKEDWHPGLCVPSRVFDQDRQPGLDPRAGG
jgi:hypothetical protein